MKKIITVGFFLLMTLWFVTAIYLSGSFDWFWLPEFLASLKKPVTTQEFADSLGITNSLFSSFALIIAVATVVLQGKEMRESTEAQRKQAEYLQMQITHHDKSAMVSSIATALNHYAMKRQWNRATIEKLEGELETKTMSNVQRVKLLRLLSNSKGVVSKSSDCIRNYESHLTRLLLGTEICNTPEPDSFSCNMEKLK